MTTNINNIREQDGSLPSYVWPGGYPMFYVTRDGMTICPDCANEEVGCADQEPVDYAINWEDPALFCNDCGDRIESAYAEDSDEDQPGGGTDLPILSADEIRAFKHGLFSERRDLNNVVSELCTDPNTTAAVMVAVNTLLEQLALYAEQTSEAQPNG